MGKIKLDLHDYYNNSEAIEYQLNLIIDEAIEREIAIVEIVTGKGTGRLKDHVLRFLKKPYIKPKYRRIEKDKKNEGRLFLHIDLDYCEY